MSESSGFNFGWILAAIIAYNVIFDDDDETKDVEVVESPTVVVQPAPEPKNNLREDIDAVRKDATAAFKMLAGEVKEVAQEISIQLEKEEAEKEKAPPVEVAKAPKPEPEPEKITPPEPETKMIRF